MVKEYGKKKGTDKFYATMHKDKIDYEQKTYFLYGTELKHVGDDIVTGFIATGKQDLVNDIITPACMMDMLGQLKNRVIKVDVEHESYQGKPGLESEINKTKIPIAKINNAVLEAEGIRVDTGLNKAWKAAWTQAAKQAYSLKSFLQQFQTPIAIAIVIIAVFVGFAMMWTRLGSVCQ